MHYHTLSFSELIGEADSDRASINRDEGSTKESNEERKTQRPPQLEIPPTLSNLNSKKSSMVSDLWIFGQLAATYFTALIIVY